MIRVSEIRKKLLEFSGKQSRQTKTGGKFLIISSKTQIYTEDEKKRDEAKMISFLNMKTKPK